MSPSPRLCPHCSPKSGIDITVFFAWARGLRFESMILGCISVAIAHNPRRLQNLNRISPRWSESNSTIILLPSQRYFRFKHPFQSQHPALLSGHRPLLHPIEYVGRSSAEGRCVFWKVAEGESRFGHPQVKWCTSWLPTVLHTT